MHEILVAIGRVKLHGLDQTMRVASQKPRQPLRNVGLSSSGRTLEAAAGTPPIKLAVETMPSLGPEPRGSQPPNAVDEVVLWMQVKTTHVDYSVVLPSKCSLSASASALVACTTPSRWFGGA